MRIAATERAAGRSGAEPIAVWLVEPAEVGRSPEMMFFLQGVAGCHKKLGRVLSGAARSMFRLKAHVLADVGLKEEETANIILTCLAELSIARSRACYACVQGGMSFRPINTPSGVSPRKSIRGLGRC